MLCRRGTRDNLCQASLCTAYYQGAQCSRLCRARAEPVSYTTAQATWQATPLASSGIVPTRQRQDMMNEGVWEQAKESRREISFACDAIMYEQYVILYYIVGPTCRGPNS